MGTSIQRANSGAASSSAERWSVPKGSERRAFLLVWLSICTYWGTENVHAAWRVALERRGEWGPAVTCLAHVAFVLHYAALVFIIAFKPVTYRKYKILLDESHLHHCQLIHILDIFFPIHGHRKRPSWVPGHCAILMINPIFHNLPLESLFRVMGTGSISHLIIRHASLMHYVGPGMPWGQYLLRMVEQALLPPAIALGVALLCGRTDMPPWDPRQGSGMSAQRTHSGAVPPSVADGRTASPPPGLPWTTRVLVACHKAQAFTQEHLRPLLILVSGTCVMYQMIRCFLQGSKDNDIHLRTHVMFEMVVMGSSYALGSNGVLAAVQPKLEGAMRLLYDLVPEHIAEALMEQDQDAANSTGSRGSSSRSGRRAHGHQLTLSSTSLSPEEQMSGQLFTPQGSLPAPTPAGEGLGGAPAPAPAPTHMHRLGSTGAAAAMAAQRGATPQPDSAHSPAGIGTPRPDTGTDAVNGSGAPLLTRTSSMQVSAAAIASQLQQAAAYLLSEQKGVAEPPAAAAAHGTAGAWSASRLVSNVLESLRESLGDTRNDGSDSGVPAAFPGQQVQVPEALTLDGKLSRTPQIASWHEHTSILFCDIQGFTDCCQAVPPSSVMAMLNELFFRIDGLCLGDSRVTKIETVGDCVMAATGLLHDDPDHAVTMLEFAAALQREAGQVLYPHNGQPLRMRVGVHSGRVMSGVVGRIRKRYCLFGDTVNTSSRMESNGEPGRIHVSQATYDLATASPRRDQWRFECRGEIPIKGKGLMVTYFAERLPSG